MVRYELIGNGTRGTTPETGGGWLDLSGNGNNGDMNNTINYNALVGGSLKFNGPTYFDYISISDTITHKTGQNFSVILVILVIIQMCCVLVEVINANYSSDSYIAMVKKF